MDLSLIKKIITTHEGLRLHVYKDSLGIKTIGVGFNLERLDAHDKIMALGLDYQSVCQGTQDLNEAQVDQLLNQDISNCINQASKTFTDLGTMNDNLSCVIVDLVFNLGYARFSFFHLFIAAVKKGDWAEAQNQLRNSYWAHQVPSRCASDCALLSQIK